MFGEAELRKYMLERQLSPQQTDYLLKAYEEPARQVGRSGFAAMTVEHRSLKMGRTVNLESRTGEFALALHLDFDDEVIAYFEQPPPVSVVRNYKGDRKRTVDYYADSLVLRRDSPEVIEVKPEDRLLRLVDEQPDWTYEGGCFRFSPAEEAFARIGIRYRVVSSSEVGQVRVSNLMILRGCIRHAQADVATDPRIQKVLGPSEVISISDLSDRIGTRSLDPILLAVASGVLWADIDSYLLSEPDTCPVVLEPWRPSQAVLLEWNKSRLSEAAAGGECTAAQHPAEKYLGYSDQRHQELMAGRNDRTARRWRASMEAGKASGLSEFASLTPGYARSGNRLPKRDPACFTFARAFIAEQWTSDSKPTFPALYRDYKLAAEEHNSAIAPLSKPTMRMLLSNAEGPLALERGGKRLANKLAQPSPTESRAMLPIRPFELASCDHYLCDLYVVVCDANGLRYAMRPWLTVLRDCYTKGVLAISISFRSPSRVSCSLIIRYCLRNHGRLPEQIVVDGGAEFRSKYFSALLSFLGINLLFRPSGHPRYGSEAEGFFQQFRSLWLSNRPASLVSEQQVREISGPRRAQSLACIQPINFWSECLSFCEWHDEYQTGSQITCPRGLREAGLARFPSSGLVRPDDEQFRLASCVDGGRYKVQPQRGIHIDDLHFYSPLLNTHAAKHVDVRIDPEQPFCVYALIDNRWITCHASRSRSFELLSHSNRWRENLVQTAPPDLKNALRNDADRGLALRRRQCASRDAAADEGQGETKRSPYPAPPHPSEPAMRWSDDLPELQLENWND